MIHFLLSILIMWSPETATATCLHYTDPESADNNTRSGIPVLMYHHVSDPVHGYYGVSTGRLLMDLQLLDEAGFFLITPDDIENGFMQVPADRRPLMLTFDDGWQDNFSFIVTGTAVEIDPNCALAILEDYSDNHPEFGRGATFFISWDKIPFGQEEFVMEKFNLLLDMGYSIGNHTDMHTDFMLLPRDKWENSVITPMHKFHRRLGLRTSEIFAMAYPGGKFPKNAGAEEYLAGFRFMGAGAVRIGFLANGSVSAFGPLLDSAEGWFRIGRLDMSQYSVRELLGWRNIMTTGQRDNLHDPLRPRIP
ncbi:MAG: polysaccharide deacetylase family protein [Candidatus Fermentibacteria bacterium]